MTRVAATFSQLFRTKQVSLAVAQILRKIQIIIQIFVIEQSIPNILNGIVSQHLSSARNIQVHTFQEYLTQVPKSPTTAAR